MLARISAGPLLRAPSSAATALRRVSPLAAVALLSFLALGFWVMKNLWFDPSGRMLTNQMDDHALFMYWFAHGERVVFNGDNPFHTDRINTPIGVNAMANTSMLALSIPFAPVTHFFGPGVTVALLLTLGLAGSAAAWYWFLRVRLGTGKAAAWVGGLWGGFAPGFLSHASGHVNFVSNYVLPFIIDQVLRLREEGRVWRGGITLGLLVVLEAFINEEALLLVALSLGFMILAYACVRPREVWAAAGRFVLGGLVAGGVALILLAYPIYYQFRGPGHYHGQPFVIDRFATSLGSIITLPRTGIFGSYAHAQHYSASPMEDTVFWGWAAVVLIIVSIVVLWRSAAAWAAAFAAVVLLLMSFGTVFRTTALMKGPKAPLGWLSEWPVFNLVTTPRYALASTAIVGLLIALAADKAFRSTRPRKYVFAACLLAALIPLFPRPVPTQDAPPVPAFFAQKMWRDYTAGDRTVVTVPLPAITSGREAIRLQALANLGFRMPRGYFMGPADPPKDYTGAWGAPVRYTASLLNEIRVKGNLPEMTPHRVALIRADLKFWKTGVVVLLPDAPHRPQLLATLTAALGSPVSVGGVELWDARTFSPAGNSPLTGRAG